MVRGVLKTLLLVRRSFYRRLFFFLFFLALTPCFVSIFVLFCCFGFDRPVELCRRFHVVVLGCGLMSDLFRSFSHLYIFLSMESFFP